MNLPDAPLKGAPGITALSGQVVDLDNKGISGVEVRVGNAKAQTDEGGRFLLTYAIPGRIVLEIDGRHAGPKRKTDYGLYEARVEAQGGQTTVLPFKSWLTPIDHEHEVQIASPTTSEVVVRTPTIPDLELHIPPGVVIRNIDGKVVKRIGITAMPADRTPVPLLDGFDVPVFFTIQPGASCLYDAKGGIGTATINMPNYHKELPQARAVVWRYEPDGIGWNGYGLGTVSPDGRHIVPDRGVVLTDFSSGECDPLKHLHRPAPERPDRVFKTSVKQ